METMETATIEALVAESVNRALAKTMDEINADLEAAGVDLEKLDQDTVEEYELVRAIIDSAEVR